METKQVPQTGQISVTKLMAVLSDILSEKYGCQITMTARPKNSARKCSGTRDSNAAAR